MKPEPLLKSEAPSLDLLGLHAAARSELLKARVSSYTRKDGMFVAEHDDNRPAAKQEAPKGRPAAGATKAPAPAPDADLPDDHNPQFSLNTLGSEHLAAAASGKHDLNKHAKIEMAKRGLNADGDWVGFQKAPAAHGLSDSDMAAAKDPAKTPISEHFQTLHPKVLRAAALGKFDLNAHAKKHAASRGIDQSGKWVGFDKAKKIHAGDQDSAPGDRPLAKAMPMGWRPPAGG